ncbi:hypothetical protein [Hyphomonas oceanitis]|uniref:Lipoprotein n=1 Tax=Hyphomonas oceanitis SCH89 TaxID=1280953 RepID=A0A059GB37_9PROT|nr:hypothetical protein [Hyphomonas oceanitis]KDA04026.1 hypothetical protein HOC_01771 [Hyphomonas oceanitis SCH89]
MRAVIFSALIGVSACSSIDPDRSLSGGIVDLDPGATGFLNQTDYENKALKFVDLLTELDPENKSGWRESAKWNSRQAETVASTDEDKLCSGDNAKMRQDQKLSCALSGFYQDATDEDFETNEVTSASSLKFRRNRVQDRIILASNQACDQYRRHLLATQSEVNFAYGNAATLTAGLGAVLTPAGTSRALSGAAAIITGSRAEYNGNFFRKLLAEVITRGIAEERDGVFKSIKKNQKESIAVYTVEQAIADAVQYNAKCSLIAGLENAQKAQTFYADPGLERLSELFDGETGDYSNLLTKISAVDSKVVPQAVQAALLQSAREELNDAEKQADAARAANNLSLKGANKLAAEKAVTEAEAVEKNAQERLGKLTAAAAKSNASPAIVPPVAATSPSQSVATTPRNQEELLDGKNN